MSAIAACIDPRHALQRRLHDWLVAAGGWMKGMALAEADGLRGMHATEDIPARTCMLHVPWSLAVTPQVARRGIVDAPDPELAAAWDSTDWLAAFLLDARRHGGPWAPLIDGLPMDFDDHPLCLPQEAWRWMPSTQVRINVQAATANFEESAARVLQALPAHARVTREALLWAHACVLTRRFGSHRLAPDERVLWPVIDMVNHDPDANLEWGEDARGLWAFAERPIARGEALTACYGRLGNSMLYALYGFCTPSNPHDQALLGLVDPGEPPIAPGVPAMRTFCVPAHPESPSARPLFDHIDRLSLGDPAVRWTLLLQACALRFNLIDPARGRVDADPPGAPPLLLAARDSELQVVREYDFLARLRLAQLRAAVKPFGEVVLGERRAG
jgi:hypothetical protein